MTALRSFSRTPPARAAGDRLSPPGDESSPHPLTEEPPIASPSGDPPPRRRRRRRIILVTMACIFLAGIFLTGGAVLAAWQRLPWIATRAIERVLPGVRAEVDGIKVILPGRLEISSLVLRSRKTGDELLRLRGGAVVMDLRELFVRRIREVRLDHPRIVVSPELLMALGAGGGREAGAGGGAGGWTVGRLVCDFGEVVVAGLGPERLTASAKFALDWTDFSTAADREHEVVLWEGRALGDGQEFLTVDMARFSFSPVALRSARRVGAVSLQGGDLLVGQALYGVIGEPGAGSAGGDAADPLVIGRLDVERLRVHIEQEAASGIRFALNTSFTNIPLSKAASALGNETQFIELADIDIVSPLDPLARVLSIRALGIEFTIAGLLRGEIASMLATGPTIHIGRDLFWFMEDAAARFGGQDGGGEGGVPGWIVRRFTLVDGRLVVGSGGRSSFGLPLTFRTSARDVSLRDLASLHASGAMEIPAQKYAFDAYQLEVESRAGELRFAYPPDQNKDNLVGTLYLDSVRWRQYLADDAWVSVTFDRQGINGLFGGSACGGYVSGGFSFFFSGDSPWLGWVAGKGISLRQFTDVFSPGNLRMTGPADFSVQVDAQRRHILRVKGDLRATAPGEVTIRKLDELLGRIPGAWPAFKQDATRIALETLRDFRHTSLEGGFWFVDSQGVFDLLLQGPEGSRNLHIVLHSDDSPSGRWKNRPDSSP
jgi:hypothetical protein